MVLVLVLLPPLAGVARRRRRAGADGAAARGWAATLAVTLGQGRGLRRADAGRRPAPLPVAPVAGRAHRLARAVHAVRGRGGGRHRVRLGGAVRRLVRARRVLRRHGDARVASSATAPRSESLPLRDAFSVLFFVSVGMLFDPRMLVREPLRVLGGARRSSWSASRSRRFALVLAAALPAQHRAHRRGEPRADRRVLVHPRGPRRVAAACCPAGGPEPDPRRRADLDRAEPARVRGDRAAAALDRCARRSSRATGAPPARSARGAAAETCRPGWLDGHVVARRLRPRRAAHRRGAAPSAASRWSSPSRTARSSSRLRDAGHGRRAAATRSDPVRARAGARRARAGCW